MQNSAKLASETKLEPKSEKVNLFGKDSIICLILFFFFFLHFAAARNTQLMGPPKQIDIYVRCRVAQKKKKKKKKTNPIYLA